MTTTIRDINELQDRRIMMEKKLPPFGYALILLTAALILFLVVWSTKNYRTYVSQSSGSVQAANKTYIMSSYSGSITELNIAEGSYVNEGDLIAHIKSTDLDMQQDSLQSQLDIYKKQKSQYEKLVKSIQDDKNYFSETDIDDQPYYYQYETYKSQVAQKAFDASPYQAAGYSDEQIKALMEQNQSEVEALYYSTLQSISASLTSVQSNIDNLQSQMDALNTGANDYYIYAPTSGVIHMDTPYKVGMVLSAGTPLATVASENSDLEVVAYVTLNDRPLLHVGDPCKIAITGLSEYSYGTLTGTVTSIDSDVTASSSGSYYKMTITPDSSPISSTQWKPWAFCSAKRSHQRSKRYERMKLNLKMLAVSAALLGLLAAGAALPASAASPLNAAAALSLPWSAAAVESVETGTYASTMTVGTQQQLSPVILPAKAARKATVTFMSNDSTIVNVTSEGVAQAVGVGTAQVVASADGVSCVYTITTELDESMIVKEMDITLASSTIAVGETTSLSLGVLPSSASNYASVSLSSSDPAVATVNNFGKVTGVAPGTATITATCGDVSASATVKVVNSGADRQSIDLNTSYVVLKPGASRTITGKVTPSSASQSLTFKSNDTKVATVSAKGVITAVGTGATSIVVSNGTASASVTVIVNRNASSSGNGGGSTDSSNGEVITDPVVEAIEADGTDEVTFAQRELPTITSEMLNALRLNGKTLVVEADNYTIRIAGRDVKNTSAQVSTALSFAPSEYGVTFTLNGGEALPGVVQVEMTGDNAAYTRVYLHNALKGKWQFLNSYKDHVLEADTAGEYLLTTQNLRFVHVDMTFFIAGLVVIVGIIIAYIVIKKRYWFW